MLGNSVTGRLHIMILTSILGVFNQMSYHKVLRLPFNNFNIIACPFMSKK